MDKPKLIDANKLLKWIEEDKAAEGFWGEGEMVHQATCSFDNLTDAIAMGKFDPDPIVTTIKPGDKPKQSCPRCGNTGTHYCRGREVVE